MPLMRPEPALQATLDLFDVGFDLMRQRLKREDPAATPAVLQERLEQWLHTRPEPRMVTPRAVVST